MIRKLLNLSIVFTLAIAALAQQPVATPNAPSVERLRAHIEYLASDKLEGRRTGSPGTNVAAEYIAREFARYGLRRSVGYDTPGMSHFEADSPKRYMQQFPYVAGVELGRNNDLSFRLSSNAGSVKLKVSEDWIPLGLSSNGRIENVGITFVGYGITASDLKYDDYAIANAAGTIAIAFSGTADGDNPHGQFAQYEDVHWKAIAARDAGAKALVVIARDENFKDDRLSGLRYDNRTVSANIPVLVVSRAAAAKLLALQDTGALSSLERESQRVSLHRISPPPGWTPEKESFLLPSTAYLLNISTDVVRREVPAYNVIGILDGSDPVLKNETIVIGAHYDHLGYGGEGSLAPSEGEIHHGADDNASGVAGVLELARIFTAQRPKPRRTMVFMAFSGEEEGLLGSNYYVNHPIMPLANTVAMINMDMIGRMRNKSLIIGGVGTAQDWRSIVERNNLLQGLTVTADGSSGQPPPSSSLPMIVGANGQMIVANDVTKQFLLTLTEDGFGPSDHSSFYAKQIPVLFLWTGTHEDYHKPSDTADKINYDDEARILSFVVRILRRVDANDKRPVYAVAKSESTGRSMGFRVYLGTIPNYADSNDGLLLDGVRDDSPAAKAGLKAGDKIVRLAGRDVRNVYDYTYALGEMKAGQEYEIELLRGGERLKLKITPAARK
jgi:aminopeptidase YwaD